MIRPCRLSVVLSLVVLATTACSGKTTQAGGLELLIATNLRTPTDFDNIELQVQQQTSDGGWGLAKIEGPFPVGTGPGEITLPTSFAILSGQSPDQSVLIQLTALKNGVPVDLREVQVQVPTTRVAQLTLIVAESCLGQVTTAGGSRCLSGQSCQPTTGMCGTNVVSSASLPDYSPNALEAGVDATVGALSRDAGVDAKRDATVGDARADSTKPMEAAVDSAIDTGTGSGSGSSSDAARDAAKDSPAEVSTHGDAERDSSSAKDASVDGGCPVTAAWKALPDLPTPRAFVAAATAPNGKIFVLGGAGNCCGHGSVDAYNVVEVFDPSAKTWSTAAPMQTARFSFAAVTGSDGLIYAIGGYNASPQPLASVEAYNTVTNSWAYVASLPTATADFSGALGSDGRIYALGGDNGGGSFNTVVALTPGAPSWTTVPSMNQPRQRMGAVTGADGRVYAISGDSTSQTVEAYVPGATSWTAVTSLNTVRYAPSVVEGKNGQIYALAGNAPVGGNLGSYLTSFESYSTTSLNWTTATPQMITARFEFAAAVGNDGTIYAFGGANASSVALPAAESFSPGCTCTPGTQQCADGAHVETCGASGQWGDVWPCAAGTTCTGGSCSGNSTAIPPSCAPGGAGLNTCPGGAGTESCCASLDVMGGTFDRTYVNSGGGATGGADPATVSNFRLDKYEVTVGRFRQFVAAWKGGYNPPAGSGKHTHLNGGNGLNANGGGFEPGWLTSDNVNVAPTNSNLACQPPYQTWTGTAGSQENLPINCMNWWEAYAFCIWDGGFLPSEAEWEYAAGGGSEQLEYPWGSTDPGTNNQYAIYGNNNCYYPGGSDNCTGVVNIAPVGTPSLGTGRWGQLDLAGNVAEWNLDWYTSSYADPCVDCAYLTSASDRSAHGGTFFGVYSPPSYLLPPTRSDVPPSFLSNGVGMRCARTP